jgi:hypothetical protein
MTSANTLATAAKPDYKNLVHHPFSDIFPLMEGPEFDALVEDIKDKGLRTPITLHDGKVLDGRNRYRACLKAYITFKDADFRVFDPKLDGDPLAYVVSANLHRRHLTESQRAAVAASLVTTKLGDNRYSKTGVTNEQAAKLLGVSEATVKVAKTVAEKAAPEIKEKVLKGELRLNAAKKVIDKPIAEQQQELDRIKKEKEAETAKRQAAKAVTSKMAKVPEANQAMIDVDTFKKKWQSFNEMQRRAFVTSFKDELAGILKYIRDQEEMIGAGRQSEPAATGG